MKKICIVPFTKTEYPLLSGLEDCFDISALISPRGIGREGQNVCVLHNRKETKYHFTNSIGNGIHASDIVLISDVPPENQSLYSFMLEALHFSANNGKIIYCCSSLSKEEINAIKMICKKSNSHFYYIDEQIAARGQFDTGGYLPYSFCVPVFYVSEMIPGCDGYDVFLALAKAFQDDGKSVLALSSDKYNHVLGYEYVSWDSNLPLERVPFSINHLVHTLVNEKKPDVILIRLPLPMMKYDEQKVFDFGLTAHCISSAVPGDGCVLCGLFETPSARFWESINKGVSAKFGFPILAAHLSNKILDSSLDNEMNLTCVSDTDVKSLLQGVQPEMPVPVFDFLNSKCLIEFYKMLKANFFDLRFGVIQ